MKIKQKLLLDFALFAIIWAVMEYHFTGNLLHEILGIILILGFLLHIILNRKYYVAMTKRLFVQHDTKGRYVLSYVVNVLLLVATVLMLVTSVLISKDLFSFLGIGGKFFAVWRVMHIVCSLVILVCMLVHILLHLSLLSAMVKQYVPSENGRKITRAASLVLAVIVFLASIRISYDSVLAIPEKQQSADTAATEAEKEISEKVPTPSEVPELPEGGEAFPKGGTFGEGGQFPDMGEFSQWGDGNGSFDGFGDTPYFKKEDGTTLEETPEEDTGKLSLNEYLKSLTCTGCGRHCSLLSPQCNKGVRQASEAEAQYNSLYGQQ